MALTSKQEAFAQAVASGLKLSDAYRIAYNVSPDTLPETVHQNASHLAVDTNVAPRIASLKAAAQAAAAEELAWDRKRMVREAATQLEIARTGGWRAVSAGNGALELIGRLIGTLSDHPDTTVTPITRVVIVLNRGRDADGHPQVVEAEYKVLNQAQNEALGSEPPDTLAAPVPEPPRIEP